MCDLYLPHLRPQASKVGGARNKAAPVVVETVAKNLADLTNEERGAALMADAPELLALLQDLTDSLAEVGYDREGVVTEARLWCMALIRPCCDPLAPACNPCNPCNPHVSFPYSRKPSGPRPHWPAGL